MKTTTAIVNSTNDVLKVKMGGPQQSAEVASIDKGGQWEMHVDPNQTYREYRLVDSSGVEAAIVSSDDCCDNECITIKESAAVGGAARKYEIHRVPRRQQKPSSQSLLQVPELASPPKAESKLTWFGWLRQLWAKK